MSTGTKVFLAVFALIVGILVVYYGVLMPPGNFTPAGSELPRQNPVQSMDTSSRQSQVRPERDSRPPIAGVERPRPIPAVSASGILRDSVQAASRQADSVSSSPVDRETKPSPVVKQTNGSQDVSIPPEHKRQLAEQSVTVTQASTDISAVTQPTAQDRTVRTPETASSPSQFVSTPATEYVVKTGDTLTSIAAEWFGDANNWSLIADANPKVDPQRLKIGQKLLLPPKNAPMQPITTQVSKDTSGYVVRSGDTLVKIARAFYGDEAKWRVIYDANRQTIGRDPGAIRPGTRLTLPKS